MLRARCTHVLFAALYQLAGGGPTWRVAKVENAFNGEYHEVRISVTGGCRTRLHVLKGL